MLTNLRKILKLISIFFIQMHKMSIVIKKTMERDYSMPSIILELVQMSQIYVKMTNPKFQNKLELLFLETHFYKKCRQPLMTPAVTSI